jgi:hypothetical protein
MGVILSLASILKKDSELWINVLIVEIRLKQKIEQ